MPTAMETENISQEVPKSWSNKAMWYYVLQELSIIHSVLGKSSLFFVVVVTQVSKA